ncbi:glycosyltransferase family 39 protein [Gordonia polyisoprenivorans]|uniref:ArnT family glycosyltransferase n=1 Tax=Gordonia polyisoprenivorans TaxID=84595 RepID=UPI002233F6F0|nr:glycosyltransferase family 39 protein [Gordonia polyisoprenivorans]
MTAILDRPSSSPPSDAAPPSHRRTGRPMPWSKLSLTGLLTITGVLYLWNLSASGYANTFYAAAAWAGSQSWRAWFFGALDPSSFITVDKPPASLWVTGLSVRIFGMNSWAVLAPQAIMGVLSVALLYATMRRVFGDARHGTAAGLIAGAVLAFTPAAALMFRFNNPDALLVLLMTAAGYCTVRAIATNSGRWLAMVGVALGFAFLTKMLQGFLVLPAFGLAYLVFANNGWLKRIGHLLLAAVALIVSSGWFVVVTILVPAASRPYIGGSTDNTFMDLVLGYNGIGRISGGDGNMGGGGGGGAGGSFGGSTGLSRLFSSEMGNEISWLLPVALFVVAFGVYLMIRSFPIFRYRNGVDRIESGAIVAWGGWLLVTGMVFSYMSGTIHPYYTVALAPAIGALVGLGSVFAWRRRAHWDGRIAMAAMIGLAAWWAIVLLNRNDWGPVWCRWLIGVVAVVAVVGVIAGSVLGLKKVVAASALAGALAGFGGTAAFSIATAATSHSGSIPTAVSTSLGGGQGGGPGGGGGTPPGGSKGNSTSNSAGSSAPQGSQNTAPQKDSSKSTSPGRGGGMGGPGVDVSSNSALVKLLQSTTTKWAAATNGSQSAAGIELSTGKAVMAIGGWSNDPAPTLDEFKKMVSEGKIAYYIGGSGGGPGGNSEISTWVSQNFTAMTVGGQTVYKLI